MRADPATISLGFTEERFPAGIHLCQIYRDDDERSELLERFLLSGLQAGERTSCFSDRTSAAGLQEFLARHGVHEDAACASGAFALSSARERYLAEDRFDPGRLLDQLSDYYEDSIRRGYPAARIIGEMPPDVQRVPGGPRFLEYEAKVLILQRRMPITTVCQYDARAFSGATIMDVLAVHPLLIVGRAVVRNPLHVPPEEFLTSRYGRAPGT